MIGLQPGALLGYLVVVVVTALALTAWLTSIGKLDGSLFGQLAMSAVVGMFALLNPQYARPPALPPSGP